MSDYKAWKDKDHPLGSCLSFLIKSIVYVTISCIFVGVLSWIHFFLTTDVVSRAPFNEPESPEMLEEMLLGYWSAGSNTTPLTFLLTDVGIKFNPPNKDKGYGLVTEYAPKWLEDISNLVSPLPTDGKTTWKAISKSFIRIEHVPAWNVFGVVHFACTYRIQFTENGTKMIVEAHIDTPNSSECSNRNTGRREFEYLGRFYDHDKEAYVNEMRAKPDQ